MVSSNVRILNSYGQLFYKGRLEINSNGHWGTVCARGLSPEAAKIICREIGYNGGRFLNPEEKVGRRFCSDFEGLNYCGVSAQFVLFSNLQCQGNEHSIMDCYRQIAPLSCSHDYDTLIECSNDNEEEFVDFKNGAVRLINAQGNPTSNGIGRLEIFRGSWGTVCNNKFTENSAKIACKQMGFFDGKLFGEPDSTEMCTNVLGDSLCGGDHQKIMVTELNCQGYEEDLRDCPSKQDPTTCSHFSDVVLQCFGMGDSTGRSQKKINKKVLDPLIGKLALPPILNLQCKDTAKQIFFRGDPGSVFIVNCPSDCSKDNSLIYGTGIFTIRSSVCKAALHSGVMTDEGGTIAVVKAYGQNKYFGSNMRNIASNDFSHTLASFYVVSSNSAYIEMVQLINNNSNFLELENKVQFISKNVKNKLLKNYLISRYSKNIQNNFSPKRLFSSFLETGENDSNNAELFCLFDWVTPNNDYSFDGLKFEDLGTINGHEKLFFYQRFSIFMKIKLKDFLGEVQTIYSIGECAGYSININTESEITFDVNCGKTIIRSGIFVPVKNSIAILITYDSTKIVFYLDGKKISESMLSMDLRMKNSVTLAKHSAFNKNFFRGKIQFLAFFNKSFGIEKAEKLFRESYVSTLKKTNSKLKTLDNRDCITSCFFQPIPGTPGSPVPPQAAVQVEVKGEKIMIASLSDPGKTESSSPYIEVNCKTTAREIFKGITNKMHSKRVKCPKKCQEFDSIVFGTTIYSTDSSVCRAAIHAGVMQGDDEAIISVKLINQIKFYLGSQQYGIRSASINTSEGSFLVELAPKLSEVTCETSALDARFSGTFGTKYLVYCPGDCSKVSHIVYGTSYYSGDSSICQAAIHSGSITDKGGEVNFIIEKGHIQYKGEKKYGIKSKDREAFIKSIRIFSLNPSSTTTYNEEFSSREITKFWEVNDNLDAEDYPSHWAYVDSPNSSIKHKAIKQSSKIRLINDDFQYGSQLLLKDLDQINLLYRISFYFVGIKPVAILFRYKDKDNYYHIRIENKIKFFKRVDSKETLLSEYNYHVIPHLAYTFKILAYENKIQVFLQIQNLRTQNKIFEVVDGELQRGSVGIATNGNNAFYVLGVFVDKYDLSKEISIPGSDVRSFENVISENNEYHRNKYCLSRFYQDHEKIKECKDYHNFCRLKCFENVHIREQILFYTCYKECVRDSIQKNKIATLEKINEMTNKPLADYGWTPKNDEKCDFKTDVGDVNGMWKPCLITGVENSVNDPERKIVNLEYSTDGSSEKRAVSILFPSNNLSKCGTKISYRTDC